MIYNKILVKIITFSFICIMMLFTISVAAADTTLQESTISTSSQSSHITSVNSISTAISSNIIKRFQINNILIKEKILSQTILSIIDIRVYANLRQINSDEEIQKTKLSEYNRIESELSLYANKLANDNNLSDQRKKQLLNKVYKIINDKQNDYEKVYFNN